MIEIIILKFTLIFLMAFLFGIERQLSHKPTGFGTFIFVAVGSCALGSMSMDISATNALTIVGGVVTGIGFLGAGALIKTTDKIFEKIFFLKKIVYKILKIKKKKIFFFFNF